MNQYQYDPIDLKRRAIRLLYLHPGPTSGDISCELIHAWLYPKEDILPYEALSYTWGSAKEPKTITVSGKNFSVTKNLYTALRQLRHNDRDRLLWIDAICINQDDNKERGHQVQQMGDIYKNAEKVLFWLCESTPKIEHLMDALSLFQKYCQNFPYRKWSKDDVRWSACWKMSVQPIIRDSQFDTLSKSLEHILGQSWFRRVWILQEVTNARAAVVCCGSKTIAPWVLSIAPQFLDVSPPDHEQAVIDVMPGPWRESSWWGKSHDLYTLLVNFGGSEATEPRDMIYALAGMSSDADTPSLYPDYTKSEEEIVGNVVKFIYSLSSEDLGILEMPKTIRALIQNLRSLCKQIVMHIILGQQYGKLDSGSALAKHRKENSSPKTNDLLQHETSGAQGRIFLNLLLTIGTEIGSVAFLSDLKMIAHDNLSSDMIAVIFHVLNNNGIVDSKIILAAIVLIMAVRNNAHRHGVFDILEHLRIVNARACEMISRLVFDEGKLRKKLFLEAFKMNPKSLSHKAYGIEGEWLVKRLLDFREESSDNALIAKYAASAPQDSEKLIKFLFDYWAKEFITITDHLLLQTFYNKSNVDEALEFLFTQIQHKTTIPQQMINVLRLLGEHDIMELFQQIFNQLKIPDIFQRIAVASNSDSSNRGATMVPSEQEMGKPITSIQSILVAHYADGVGMKRFIDVCDTQLVITAPVVSAILANKFRDEAMSEILCHSSEYVSISIDAALEIVNTMGQPHVEHLLLYGDGVFFTHMRIKDQLLAMRSVNGAGLILDTITGDYVRTRRLIMGPSNIIDVETRYNVYIRYLSDLRHLIPFQKRYDMEKWLCYGAEDEWKRKVGDTALMWEIRHDRFHKKLLERSKTVNTANKMGMTPLILACYLGNLIAVKQLLELGADITRSDRFGRKARDWAVVNRDLKMLVYL